MRSIFERLFLPAMEATHDPRIEVAASLAAHARLAGYEAERVDRMAEYAEAWRAKGLLTGREQIEGAARRVVRMDWRRHG